MKIIVSLILLSVSFFSCIDASKKSENSIVQNTEFMQSEFAEINAIDTLKIDINPTITTIIKAYQNKDESTINSFILEDFGIAILYSRGAFTTISIKQKLSFKEPTPSYYPYKNEMETSNTINTDSLPVFSCETESWNKPPGIYVDSNYREKFLSTIANFENEYIEENTWSEKEIKELEAIENNSKKVIVIGNKQETFIFYLAIFNNQYYLVGIDRTEFCSA